MASARSAPAPAAPRLAFWRTPIFAATLIAGTALLAYLNSFSVPFVFDDEPSILSNPTIHSLAQAWWPPQDNGGITVAGRPLLNFSLGINYAISGTNVWSYHVLNLLIHALAGIVLFGVVRRTLLQPTLAKPFGSHAFELALLSAALWTLHPLQTESVTYIIQRAESMVGLFYLLTLWCFIRSVEPRASKRWARWAVVTCVLGMLTKEVMVSAPLIVALYDRTFVAGSWREVWARRRGFHLALASTLLVLCALVLSNLDRGGTAGAGMKTTSFTYALTQIPAVVHYLRLVFWPAPQILDYGGALVRDWHEAVLPALILVPLGVASLWAAWRGQPAGVCGVLFFATLAPSSSFVPLLQTMAEHRMYLPLAAVIVLAVMTAYLLLGKKAFAVLTVAVVALAVTTVRRNQDYSSAIRIYEDTVAKRPTNARAMALLADYYRRAGQLESSRTWLERSLAQEPNVPEVLNNLGTVCQELGDPEKATIYFQTALSVKPGDVATLNNLGSALILSGHAPEGIIQLEAALRIAPSSPTTLSNLANALAQGGRMAEAAADFENLLKARPDDTEARSRYSNVLLALGRGDEALAQMELAVRTQPGNAELHNRLGVVLARARRMREALEQFDEALRLDPANGSARKNAARARQMLGG